tara:strand:+ start:600 stop:1901 length:1302 start_codon:yes stop_codon:yes gene_type:complete
MTKTYKEFNGSRNIILSLFVTVLLFNVFRSNIIIYYSVLSSLYLIFILDYLKNPRIFILNSAVTISYVLLLLFFLLSLIISFSNLDTFSILKSMPRMLIMPLIPLVIYKFLQSEESFRKVLLLYLFLTFLAALSLILQGIIGPINALGEPALRAVDSLRYNSLFGSENMYGCAVGSSLIISFFILEKKIIKILFFSIILVSTIFTLSKAAFLNILIAFIFIFIFSKNKIFILLSGFTTLILFLYITIYFPNNVFSEYFNTLLTILFNINFSEDLIINDTGRLIDNIFYRLFGETGFQNFSLFDFLFGVGLAGGGGVFGLSGETIFTRYYTSHNQFLDLIQIGGLGLLISLIILMYVNIQFHVINFRANKDILSKIFILITFVVIINMVFNNAVLFHPPSSIMFWISISYAIFKCTHENFNNDPIFLAGKLYNK